MSDLEAVRQFYAEELRAVANLKSERLVKAFAKVPREHFLGPGPWQIVNPWWLETDPSYRTTSDADPRHLYHNVLVGIDPNRRLNNGQPSFLAFLIDSLELQEGEHVVHIGCGTGYYTAIMAEVVGSNGRVTAIEIDPDLARHARSNLSYLAHVQIIEGDGGKHDPGPSDAILVNAGVTHPSLVWLDSLRHGGRLLLFLTAETDTAGSGGGYVLKVTFKPGGLACCFISRVGVFSCVGTRDPELNEKLKNAFTGETWKSVQSLRRDAHEATDTCWLHGETFCLSKLAVLE